MSKVEEKEQEKFQLDVLNVSQTSQIQFGLRNEDYTRYRHYCSKRLLVVRRQLKKIYGKKSVLNKISDPKQINDQRYLVITLLKAERAWAYAMDLKREFEQGGDSRLNFHIIRRLDKASKHADQLESYCKQVADNLTIIESQAYAAWMKSSFLIVKKQWNEALEAITISKTIYEELAKSGHHSQRDLYNKRVEDSEPVIRFCKYNLRGLQKKEGEQQSIQVQSETLDSIKVQLGEILIKRETTQLPMQFITWKSKVIEVTDEKLREKLVLFDSFKKENESKLPTNVQTIDFEKTTNLPDIFAIYDKLVSFLINCELIVKTDVNNLIRINTKNKTVKTEIEEAVQRNLLAFIMYHKMKYLYDRNQILIQLFQKAIDGEKVNSQVIKKKKKISLKDLVRLSTHQIRVFTCLADSRDTDTVKESAKDYDAQIILLKSFRLFYIALCLCQNQKFSETVALLDRVLANIQNVKKINSKSPNIQAEISSLESNIKKQRSQIHANSFIQQLTQNEELKSQMSTLSLNQQNNNTEKSKDLLSGLDSFDTSFIAEKKFVSLTAPIQPITAKPLFFDIAFNSCTFPSLESRKASSSSSSSSQPQGESKGFFGSFWGKK
ncbi:hypothetical protein CYY_005270 [Polysphondylium violaceum]|uniref:Signal recognition particle subunit SRP68 n=1 Tax=Polysphondylium violaceum TaxID=133409 RepID=A0A8J4PUN8_9MYCE|nr:hypothetical protein CYY_005270 [Polysphondylium violaceum]